MESERFPARPLSRSLRTSACFERHHHVTLLRIAVVAVSSRPTDLGLLDCSGASGDLQDGFGSVDETGCEQWILGEATTRWRNGLRLLNGEGPKVGGLVEAGLGF